MSRDLVRLRGAATGAQPCLNAAQFVASGTRTTPFPQVDRVARIFGVSAWRDEGVTTGRS
jgi:hypothetical protein